MQKDIDTFMEKFDHEASRKALQEKEAMQEDEDGWIMVTKRSVVEQVSKTGYNIYLAVTRLW